MHLFGLSFILFLFKLSYGPTFWNNTDVTQSCLLDCLKKINKVLFRDYDTVQKDWKKCGILLIYYGVSSSLGKKTSMTFRDFLQFPILWSQKTKLFFVTFFYCLCFFRTFSTNLCYHEKDENCTAIHIYAIIFFIEPEDKASYCIIYVLVIYERKLW